MSTMKKRCARSFSLEKDGFIGELYTGTRAPGKAILYVGGAGCRKKMTLMMRQYLADAAEKRMMAVLKETGFHHHADLKLYDSKAHGLGVGELSGAYKLLAGLAVKEDRAAAEDARQYVIAWLGRWVKGDL